MNARSETAPTASRAVGPSRRKRPRGIRGRENLAGWIYVLPALLVLGLFLLIPVIMAAWVSVSNWGGRGSPFSSDVSFVGADNYRAILLGGGLATQDFGTALRNNSYYVLFVVPMQTVLSLYLAIMVNRRILRGRGFFRTAFYFPSVTSSVAITVLWLFLFSATGVVNAALAMVGIDGPNWFNDPRGLIHVFLSWAGVDSAPAWATSWGFLGISGWEWLAGPSIAMFALMLMAVFTTSGTFMLLFIAALQALSAEVDEAATMDGTTVWQRIRFITVPMLRPTIFTVVTLGLIGTWQVFDQIYTGTQGGPAKTTLTPAYLSYQAAFLDQQWGRGSAIAFILFAIIVIFTIIQRLVLRERDTVPKRKRFVPPSQEAVEKARKMGVTP